MNMTTMQLNEELFHQLAIIAKDEGLMRKAVKALKRIAGKEAPETPRMSREEFYARIEKASQGESRSFADVNELNNYVSSL